MQNTENAKQNVQITVHEAVNTDSELYKIGAVITTAFAGVVGIWSTICLSSALFSENGPVGLATSLFGAISGTM